MHYYQHHIGDFRAGCHNFETRMERWIYRDMIEAYYDRELPFPDDIGQICAMLGLRRETEREIVAGILVLKFQQTDRGWEHERCEKEITKYHASLAQASAAGTASALAKKAAKEAKAAEKAAAAAKPATTVQQEINVNSTTVERPLNDRSTELSEPPTELNDQATNQELITKNHKPEKVKPTAPPDGETGEGAQPDLSAGDAVMPAVRVVFEYWQKVMGHPKSILDGKRMRAIRGRLKDGYTPEQLCKAVDGCKASPRHMGQNQQNTVYDDIELICRDATKVDSFIAHANKAADPRAKAAAMLGKVGATNLAAAEAWLNGSGGHHG